MIILQSSIGSFTPFSEEDEETITESIKASTKKEIVIVRDGEGFYKFEGKRGSFTKIAVDVKILVKKPPSATDPPKLDEEEKLSIFKEWYASNKRLPEPDELYGNLNVDKYYRKYYKDKQFVEKIREIVGTCPQ